ncbi:MAG TPA: UbiA family prenyltransferase [Planctomycetota bacterium]|nr:UbiA family prenyltransferase [Planctomycetota bacterium]
MPLPPLLRIARPALAPTAAADILAGAAFAGGGPPLRVAAAAGAAVCIYMGGMVLNDLCDLAIDREREPLRPLVKDPGLVPRARALAAALFVAGLALGAVAGLFLHALVVAVVAAAYDLGLKRTFPADALAMGGARAANLSMGLAAGGYGAPMPALAYAAGYLVFIGAVSGASRAEDMEPRETRRLALCFAGVALLAGYGALAFAAGPLALLPVPLHLIALVAAIRAGTRPAAKALVFRSLLLIYGVHAAVLAGAGETGGLAALAACAAATFFILAPARSGPSGRSPSSAPGTSAGGSAEAPGTSGRRG